jgi:hypothetical protein
MKWNRVVLGAIATLLSTTIRVSATPTVETVADYIARTIYRNRSHPRKA